MYPRRWAELHGQKAAVVAAETGRGVTYQELEERSARLACLWQSAGLGTGDHVAVLLGNDLRYFEVVWAALRSGMYLTTVNSHLTANEAGYIVDDCDARALVTSSELADVAAALPDAAPRCELRLMMDGAIDGFRNYDEATAAFRGREPVEDLLGEFMLYSSGTTGRPKGVARPLSGRTVADGMGLTRLLQRLFTLDEHSVYLSPAPLYHGSPIAFCTAAQSLGATVVIMRRFDPELSLAAIERFAVTHSQWVPTMFTRLLRLDEETRNRHNLCSHRVAIHAAAPCPVRIKQAMMDWWGPILHEYYSGTELSGLTYVGPGDWLAHPGTVGRAVVGELHVCDEDGAELPPGHIGLVYFSRKRDRHFEYHRDPGQTREGRNPRDGSLTTFGDVGWVDEDGYLYLTDRANFVIVSGGVNVYPQEAENCLASHPDVDDVCVIGVPDGEMGEQVKAVAQLRPGIAASSETEQRLIDYTRDELSHYKCPRSVSFTDELPRLPSGKLDKRTVRDTFWRNHVTWIS